MLLKHLLEYFWDNYWYCRLGCPHASVHTVYSQSMCVVLPSLFLVRFVPNDAAGDHQVTAAASSLLPSKPQGPTQDGHACRRIFEQVTTKHPVFCCSLVIMNHSSCAESTRLPKIIK